MFGLLRGGFGQSRAQWPVCPHRRHTIPPGFMPGACVGRALRGGGLLPFPLPFLPFDVDIDPFVLPFRDFPFPPLEELGCEPFATSGMGI